MTFDDDKDKSSKTVHVPIGASLLEAAHANDIDLEGGFLFCIRLDRGIQDHIVFVYPRLMLIYTTFLKYGWGQGLVRAL